ncbi:MAG: hypothetical protein U1F76_29260 [Candidatus Competibacteraceae bacterium]
MVASLEALAGIPADSPVGVRRETPLMEDEGDGRQQPTGEVTFPEGMDGNRLRGVGAVEMTGYSARAAPLVGNPVHTDTGRLAVIPDQDRMQRQTDTHTRGQEEVGMETGWCRRQQDGGWTKTSPTGGRQAA